MLGKVYARPRKGGPKLEPTVHPLILHFNLLRYPKTMVVCEFWLLGNL